MMIRVFTEHQQPQSVLLNNKEHRHEFKYFLLRYVSFHWTQTQQERKTMLRGSAIIRHDAECMAFPQLLKEQPLSEVF